MFAGVWLHGEAVAAGMVMAADMSHRLGWIDQSILDRTRRLLQRAHLPVEPPQVNARWLHLCENLRTLLVHITVSCYCIGIINPQSYAYVSCMSESASGLAAVDSALCS